MLAAWFSLAAAAGLATWGYHTKLVDLRYETLRSDKVNQAITFVHLSDLHGSTRWLNGRLSGIVNRIAPDFVCVTGDLASSQTQLPRVLDELAAIRCGDGMYFIPGNYEREEAVGFRKRPIPFPIRLSASDSPLKLLINEGIELACRGNRLRLYGFDNSIYGNEQHKDHFEKVADTYSLVLAHCPSIIHYMHKNRLPFDLLLAGHTHGGQIRWLNRTWGAYRHYHTGLQEVSPGSYFGISRGLGTVKLPLRLNCRPEITVYRLEPL